MHCRTCGKEVLEQAVVCVSCGCPPRIGNKFCQSCAAETLQQQIMCVKCGVSLKGGRNAADGLIVASDPPKDPVLMCVLTVLIPGVGQMLCGQLAKGITLFVVSAFFIFITLGFGVFISLPVVGYDGYRIAMKLKEGKTVTPWEMF